MVLTLASIVVLAAPERSTQCTGLGDAILMRRDEDWRCNAVTQHPELQTPRLCAKDNKFIPRIITLKNESIGNGDYRLTIDPTFAYEDGRLKYEFVLKEVHCAPFSAVIDVVNHRQRTPEQVNAEKVVLGILLLIVIMIQPYMM
jgi:hypothetical protein